MNRPWTPEEDAYLRAHYVKEGSAPCAKRLGRTVYAVRTHAGKLGLWVLRSNAWTQEEIDYLVQHYKSDTGKVCARHLGRSLESVQGKASDLGITRAQAYPRRRWAPKDDEQLESLASTTTVIQAARRLNRSTHSVRNRAFQLGIRFRDHREWYTTGDAARIIGCSVNMVFGAVQSGRLKAKRTEPTKSVVQNAKFGRKWRIEREDLRQFVLDYRATLTGGTPDWVALFDLLGV